MRRTLITPKLYALMYLSMNALNKKVNERIKICKQKCIILNLLDWVAYLLNDTWNKILEEACWLASWSNSFAIVFFGVKIDLIEFEIKSVILISSTFMAHWLFSQLFRPRNLQLHWHCLSKTHINLKLT